ncbi:GntR family transcriptional regulator [Actibacterium mucosum KCTC 23349]|uniref:GntR family transcriptional regulator n=1 Tax=Actibacterium mucosum KCTC 23349 TaxID=1454373 RepID=A0A037ZE06_9RHOB|nr:GntR family transcriptional regulator [Actibacterium mucosum KCTC 23349]
MFRRDNSQDDTIVSMLASALRRDISFGALRPDQKLKINELRSRYGGSNHSMRETLRILASEGLVEATSQRGFRVTSATEDDMRDIALVRGEVEKIALTLALDKGDIAWEGRVIAAHHTLQKSEAAVADSSDDLTALEWDEACRAFSAAMIEACESPRLIEMQRRLFDQSRRFRLALLREGRLDFAARKDRQRALLNAVLARDVATALTLIEREIEADLKTGT